MKLLAADFIKTCVSLEQCPQDRLPELACVGRSNVGKSSLINALLNRKSLAKVSSTPGKTRALNFFRIQTTDAALRHFYLVDLPGYGYAKVSRTAREQWGPLIEQYFAQRDQLKAVLLLVDAGVLRPQDAMTHAWLLRWGQQPIVVATKIDKLKRHARGSALATIRTHMGLPAEAALVPYSSVTREGTEELWRLIRMALGGVPTSAPGV